MGNGKGSRVLVVDDDSDVLESIAEAIEDRFKVLTASSGPEALNIIETEHPEIVFSNQPMSPMTRLELLEKVAASGLTPGGCSTPDTPISRSSSKEWIAISCNGISPNRGRLKSYTGCWMRRPSFIFRTWIALRSSLKPSRGSGTNRSRIGRTAC
jgi:hypothetical protein